MPRRPATPQAGFASRDNPIVELILLTRVFAACDGTLVTDESALTSAAVGDQRLHPPFIGPANRSKMPCECRLLQWHRRIRGQWLDLVPDEKGDARDQKVRGIAASDRPCSNRRLRAGGDRGYREGSVRRRA